MFIVRVVLDFSPCCDCGWSMDCFDFLVRMKWRIGAPASLARDTHRCLHTRIHIHFYVVYSVIQEMQLLPCSICLHITIKVIMRNLATVDSTLSYLIRFHYFWWLVIHCTAGYVEHYFQQLVVRRRYAQSHVIHIILSSGQLFIVPLE